MSRIVLIVLFTMLALPAWGQAPPQQQTPPPPLQPPTSTPSGSQRGNGDPQTIDPTKNVLDLVGALKEMLKELRISDKELNDVRFKSAEQLNDLRARQSQELATALASKLSDEAKLRADFSDRLALAESKRIDAIRAVDVNAVAVANERATATATALAKTVGDSALVLSTQVTKSADDVRTLVKTTADEQNRNLQQTFTGIQTQFTSMGTRLTALEQAGAEGVGRQKFQDPNTLRLTQLVEGLVQARATTAGVDQGSATTWALIGTIIVMLLMFGGFILNVTRSKQA